MVNQLNLEYGSDTKWKIDFYYFYFEIYPDHNLDLARFIQL